MRYYAFFKTEKNIKAPFQKALYHSATEEAFNAK